ncbi:unnamed protein product [Amoebophrya sp. A120]|nr:unnamed protein product [Amoebophrya sp. A120]|eukprot:GSA120T00013015001.1
MLHVFLSARNRKLPTFYFLLLLGSFFFYNPASTAANAEIIHTVHTATQHITGAKPLQFLSQRRGAVERVVEKFIRDTYGVSGATGGSAEESASGINEEVPPNQEESANAVDTLLQQAPSPETMRSALLYSVVIYLGLLTVMSILYFSSSQGVDDTDFIVPGGFSDEIYDCFAQPNVCVASFCCPFARWSDTVSQADLLPFNVGLALWILAGLIDLAWFFPAGFLILVVLGSYHRMRLRRVYKLPTQNVSDVLSYLFCMPCAIAQEARHAERVRSIAEAVQNGPRTHFNNVSKPRMQQPADAIPKQR